MLSEEELEEIRRRHEHIGIEWVRKSGLRAELLEERHVRMVMPMTQQHLNHVGIAYAGTEFVTLEMSTGALFFCTYGQKEYVPIVRSIKIDYLRPTQKDLIADLSMTQEEADERIRPIKENGKGDMEIPVTLQDADGRIVAKAQVIFYVIPYTQNFMAKR